MGVAIGETIAATDGVLFGRRTYEGYGAFWPGQPPDEDPIAAAMNGLRKYVAASTLKKVSWENSTLLGDDVFAEVQETEKQPGKDISADARIAATAHGGGATISSLRRRHSGHCEPA